MEGVDPMALCPHGKGEGCGGARGCSTGEASMERKVGHTGGRFSPFGLGSSLLGFLLFLLHAVPCGFSILLLFLKGLYNNTLFRPPHFPTSCPQPVTTFYFAFFFFLNFD